MATDTPTASATKDIRPQPGPQEDFLAASADVVIYGGAAGGGKSWALLLDPLRWSTLPDFRGVILRRTFPEIQNPGGLWDESFKLYGAAGGRPNRSLHEWEFASGATIGFGHCQHEKDLLNWHGAQLDVIGFDELTHFTRKMFFYLLSRNRGQSGVEPYVRATCNPDAASWVAEFIAWWIDDRTGYPIPERAGVVRYFCVVSDQVHWADTRDELVNSFGEFAEIEPKSCTFIPATLEDNPALLATNPGYRANLLAQRHVDQERLLRGNWKIVDDEGVEWPAEYFMDIWAERDPDRFELSTIAVDPSKGKESRAKPTQGKLGDYSAIVFVGISGGVLYVDADIERRPVPQIIADVAELAWQRQAESVAFESNQFQELMLPIFEDYCHANGFPAWDVIGIENYNVNKNVRIRRLSGWLKQGKLKLMRRSKGNSLLLQQLQAFPIGDHDDGPDALEMGIRHLSEMVRGYHESVEEEVLTA